MRIAHCGLLLLLAAPLAAAAALPSPAAPAQDTQNQSDALAAAARRAREQQKDQPKAAKVWDNDNIPQSGGVEVVGPAAPSSAASPSSAAESVKAEAPAAKPDEKAAKAKEKSKLDSQLKAAKDDLKNLQTQLDFLQRKYSLDQHSFYQNPNYSSDAAGAANLKDEQNQIDAKQQAVQAAEDKVADLEAQQAKAADTGGNSKDTSAK
jgi:DNA repair exonuclease SbcCD ATPase subunit